MDDEIQRDPGSAVANYWLAVAARGAGDLDGAWNAAIAALGPRPRCRRRRRASCVTISIAW